MPGFRGRLVLGNIDSSGCYSTDAGFLQDVCGGPHSAIRNVENIVGLHLDILFPAAHHLFQIDCCDLNKPIPVPHDTDMLHSRVSGLSPREGDCLYNRQVCVVSEKKSSGPGDLADYVDNPCLADCNHVAGLDYVRGILKAAIVSNCDLLGERWESLCEQS